MFENEVLCYGRKAKLIDRIVAITPRTRSGVGYNPYAGSVHHQWVGNVKPGPLVLDRLLYMKVDPTLRTAKIAEWNNPIWWPIVLIVLALLAAVVPAFRTWKRRERENAARGLAAGGAE